MMAEMDTKSHKGGQAVAEAVPTTGHRTELPGGHVRWDWRPQWKARLSWVLGSHGRPVSRGGHSVESASMAWWRMDKGP
jgi:hypothetical protein